MSKPADNLSPQIYKMCVAKRVLIICLIHLECISSFMQEDGIGFFPHKERSSTGTHKGSNILGSYYYTKNSRDCLAFSCSQLYN